MFYLTKYFEFTKIQKCQEQKNVFQYLPNDYVKLFLCKTDPFFLSMTLMHNFDTDIFKHTFFGGWDDEPKFF